ncbi:hypothetical protein [Streptomyces sp. NPDC088925]|uniref:hypothetical protein n=1 Tax=Streptomyces sp. NPDC088925 TaxID=3365914 RepID=UPI00380EF47D
MASPSYRYIITDALTGNVLAWDLPFSGVEFGPALSASGSLTATLSPRLAHLARLDAGNTRLYVERDGRLLWGGIVWRAEPEGGVLRVEASGVGSYPHRRYDLHGQLNARGPYVNADPCSVLRDVWAYCQETPDGDLAVTVESVTSKVKVGTPTDPYRVDWWDTRALGEVVDDMAALEGGPEWTEEAVWKNGVPADSIRIGWPRLGRRRTDLLFESGMNISAPVPVVYDADTAGQVVVALGAGEGRNRRRAVDAVRDSRLRLESLLELPNEKATDRLVSRARTERISRQVIGEVTEVELVDHPAAPFGGWQIGDDILVRVHDQWTEYNAWSRIVGWQIRPGQDDVPERAVVQLRRSDRFTYGGGTV